MARVGGNKISVVEAAYNRAASDDEWLRELARVSAPLISEGLGVMACVYYGAHGQRLRGGAFATADMALSPNLFLQALGLVDPSFADRTWRSLSFGLCSEAVPLAMIPGMQPLTDAGVVDVLNINAYDPSGVGVWLGAPLPKERKRRPNEAEAWMRVAAHIGSAFRLKQHATLAPSPDDATAVLDTKGRIEHASDGHTADRLRNELHAAVVRMERARGPMRRQDPDGAVATWRTLVGAELTLLDHFDSGGKRYIIAVANPQRASAPRLPEMSPRERQVALAAAAGRSNKLIAYELGIAYSTVRVLLARAAQRLKAKSRRELVAILRAYQ